MSNMLQGVIQVDCHFHVIAVDGNGLAYSGIAPCIRQSRESGSFGKRRVPKRALDVIIEFAWIQIQESDLVVLDEERLIAMLFAIFNMAVNSFRST
jgi:hypothetical protein